MRDLTQSQLEWCDKHLVTATHPRLFADMRQAAQMRRAVLQSRREWLAALQKAQAKKAQE
jgi:hypothetical protein